MVKEIYVLHGHWETVEERGMITVKASFDESKCIKLLNEIAETEGVKYCILNDEKLDIEHDSTRLEIRDMEDGGFIGFYITEHIVDIPEELEEVIYRKVKRQYLINDARDVIAELYEASSISAEQFDLAKDDIEILKSIVDEYERTTDINIASKVTMDEAVKRILKELKFT